MNLSTEQLAELLAGIARSQQAIIDAIESESGGWRNTHLLPKLTTAANMRLATTRLLDIPSRVLLRSQSRSPMDVATIARALEEAAALPGQPVAAVVAPVVAPPVAVAAATASPLAVPIAAASAMSGATDADLDNFFEN